MYRQTARLIMYGNLGKDSILMKLGNIFEEMERAEREAAKEDLVRAVYDQVYRLLDLATKYGFDKNLWQCYIAYILATNENPFSILCETVGAGDGTANTIVKQDMECFYHLFHYDFSRAEEKLGVHCFEILTHYHSMAKAENTYNKSVSEKVRELAEELEKAKNGEEMFAIVTEFYRRYGVGRFGLNKAFRVIHPEGRPMVLSPITHTSDVVLEDLVGYELQKQQLIENTEAFVDGQRANNCLLFGDSGTGKSTCIKAILNRYYDRGLRLIEVYKHQFRDLSNIIEQVKNRNYKFIIYMDDLSFEEFEIEYKYLKAVIEGGMEVRPDNVLIYATSNRRHLIRETWSDRSDMSEDELHRSDTMQEKLSLVARFGVCINFSRPMKKEFDEIVLALAAREPDIELAREDILARANVWSLRNGGYSGRAAEQFITHLKHVIK